MHFFSAMVLKIPCVVLLEAISQFIGTVWKISGYNIIISQPMRPKVLYHTPNFSACTHIVITHPTVKTAMSSA